jgi:HSP20 family protein
MRMLMRFEPFREMDRIVQMATEAALTPRSFPLDAYRRGEKFIVQFDLPGVDASSIDLEVERNVLTVKGERRFARQDGDEIVAAERPQGIFTRQLMLGDALDGERINADYNDGVLTLMIPISERAKPRKVEISTHGDPQTIQSHGNGAQHSEGNGAQHAEGNAAQQPEMADSPG